MRIWLATPKRWNLLNNSKMVPIYIQIVSNPSFKVIFISRIIYQQITLLRMNFLQNSYRIHSKTKLTPLMPSSPLDRLQLYHDKRSTRFSDFVITTSPFNLCTAEGVIVLSKSFIH